MTNIVMNWLFTRAYLLSQIAIKSSSVVIGHQLCVTTTKKPRLPNALLVIRAYTAVGGSAIYLGQSVATTSF